MGSVDLTAPKVAAGKILVDVVVCLWRMIYFLPEKISHQLIDIAT